MELKPRASQSSDIISRKRHYLLIVEYDGSRYAGFQIQKNAKTIQGEIERALALFLRHRVRIHFAGRTDAGVHALEQVVSFHSSVADLEMRRLISALNGILPHDIAIHAAAEAAHEFHPRYSCLAREYRYLIWNDPTPTALWKDRSLWYRENIALEELDRALAQLVGQHDFAAFAPPRSYRGAGRGGTRRHIYAASACRNGSLLSIAVCGSSFLHNMIRTMIGTLLDLLSGRLGHSLAEILISRDRRLAGHTAAAKGLYLYRAYYPAHLAPKCLSIWREELPPAPGFPFG